ncbi:hypothetical protein CTI14_68285, partial [Methylobacterium radiotolerans]
MRSEAMLTALSPLHLAALSLTVEVYNRYTGYFEARRRAPLRPRPLPAVRSEAMLTALSPLHLAALSL